MEEEGTQLMAALELLLHLEFPLLDESDRTNNQIGLQSVKDAYVRLRKLDRENDIP